MPLMFLERLPWPSLQTYIGLSVVLLAGCTYSAYSTLTDFRLKVSSLDEAPPSSVYDTTQPPDQDVDSEVVFATVLWYLINDSVYVWVSLMFIIFCLQIHTSCCLALFIQTCF